MANSLCCVAQWVTSGECKQILAPVSRCRILPKFRLACHPKSHDGGSHDQGRRAAHPASACARRCSARCMRGRSRRSRRRAASCISPSIPRARPAKRRPRRARRFLRPARARAAASRRAKHHRVTLGGATLRWEQHSEFTTYTWELPSQGGDAVPSGRGVAGGADGERCRSRGRCWSRSTCICWRTTKKKIALEQLFDRASLAVAENSDGDALFATDFQADPAGFVRILVLDRGLGPERAGAAGAAHRRTGDLPHAGAARPARGAAADRRRSTASRRGSAK